MRKGIKMSRSIKKQWAFLGAIAGLVFAPLRAQSGEPESWNGRIYEGCSADLVTETQFLDRALLNMQVILGEKHLTSAVQSRQAWVIEQILERDFFPMQRWTLAWEFLNRKDQKNIDEQVADYLHGNGTAESLVAQLMGSASYGSYAPLFEVLKSKRGDLLATNLSREEKAPVVQNGIGAVNPALLPPGFMMGGDAYFRRFRDAMGGHASEEKLRNYFAAQCLTDDVIAYTWAQLPENERRFLIVGSFHSDYDDGVVARIRDRVNGQAPLTLRFIDAADFTRDELNAQWRSLIQSEEFGPIADFVLFVNEPK